MSNRLTDRRGRVPLPAVCASKQLWFDQVQAGLGLPTPIFGELSIFDTLNFPLPGPVVQTLRLDKEPTELRWISTKSIVIFDAAALAVLNPIDLTWTLEFDFDFQHYAGIQPPQLIAQSFLAQGRDPSQRVTVGFDLHGPRFTTGTFHLQWI